MSKLDFWDAVHLRNGLPLKRLPIHYGCSEPYNVQYAISFKKCEFVTLRHNELRENISEIPEKVTRNVKLDPDL